MNILANAIDALESQRVSSEQLGSEMLTPQPSLRIQICTEVVGSSEPTEDSKSVVIRIWDNGPGMTERVRLMLFDPFFTTKPVGQGTGLGLSISYQIVVAGHGGQLECVSVSGQGTEFIIQIPIVQSNRKPPASNKATPEPQTLRSKNRQICQYSEQPTY
jgi:signal transduction histidine kinase